ncbi:baculoviral IAP repeat-containing protein 7 [Biomphalaria pfeifferi]|uniref:Baculoviral IAP repeat-containing protein 7 n=1 Tax=Biomphalaria pfeifferi TaxID=112525 RepID=A0AAD8C0U5_BIOPF|nr:baculoviral IAP repeat-containing protein 7 [Biomphalaria pfeifferi]
MLKFGFTFVFIISFFIMAYMSQECCETSILSKLYNIIKARESPSSRPDQRQEMCFQSEVDFKLKNQVAAQDPISFSKSQSLETCKFLNEAYRVKLKTSSERHLSFWRQHNDFIKSEISFFSLIIAILFLRLVSASKRSIDKKSYWHSVNTFIDILSFRKFLDKINDKVTLGDNKWMSYAEKTFQTTDVIVFPLQIGYSRRLASFSSLRHSSDLSDRVSFLALSNAGFYFSHDDQEIKCEGCNEILRTEALDGSGDPSDDTFHYEDCSFVHTLRSSEVQTNTTSQPNSELAIDGGLDSEVSKAISNNDLVVKSDIRSNANVNPAKNLASQYEHVLDDDSSLIRSAAPLRHESDVSSTLSHRSGDTQTPEFCQDPIESKYDSASCDSGYTSDQDLVFVGAENVVFESQVKTSVFRGLGDCHKNPGHYAYFPIHRLKLEQLPSKTRCPEVLEFLKQISKLTVRLSVNCTSTRRHKKDPLFGSTVSRVGTGFISLNKRDNEIGQIKNTDQRKWKPFKAYMKQLLKKDKEIILIETSRHLVYDIDEAVSTVVEFLSDDENKKVLKLLKVVFVETSDVIGDQKCTLVCQTSDQTFVRQIQQIKQNVLELANKLPQRSKKAMTKKLFIVEYPHGGEKVLSYGDSVQVKYQLLKHPQRRLLSFEKVNNKDLATIDIVSLRKMLLYAADTCEGSSGSPVITFVKNATDGRYDLDTWVHNGQHKVHGLGCSVMKECTRLDIEMNPSQAEVNESDSEDENSPGNQRVQSPVFKVLQKPSYPVFVTYQKRLETFSNWSYCEIFEPELLATAGFFYAGYQDCVRCFQCGLGLRSWRAGDDLYAQHDKYKPSCPFLQAQFKLNPSKQMCQQDGHQNSQVTCENTSQDLNCNVRQEAADKTSCTSHDYDPSRSTANQKPMESKETGLKLLKKENEILRVQLMCKVCRTAPVKDLFLPCVRMRNAKKMISQCLEKDVLQRCTVTKNTLKLYERCFHLSIVSV